VNGARRLIEALAEVVAANIAEERIERAILGARGAKPSRECGGASKAAQARYGGRVRLAAKSGHTIQSCDVSLRAHCGLSAAPDENRG
jgi:hypothetical protein